MKRIAAVAGLCFAALALGCAQNIVQERGGSGATSLTARRRRGRSRSPRGGAAAAQPVPARDAAALVSSYVAESFAARGSTPSRRRTCSRRSASGPSDASVVQAARERFGADVVVMGSVHRWRERGGQAMGTLTPASVGFEVKPYTTADGKLFRGLHLRPHAGRAQRERAHRRALPGRRHALAHRRRARALGRLADRADRCPLTAAVTRADPRDRPPGRALRAALAGALRSRRRSTATIPAPWRRASSRRARRACTSSISTARGPGGRATATPCARS